jgi:hypothetical protein
MPTLGPVPNLELGLSSIFFYYYIRVFFGTEKSSNGAKKDLSSSLPPNHSQTRAWGWSHNQIKVQPFFCSCKAFLGAKRSSKGVQGAKTKPKENLGCLPPFFFLSLTFWV